MVSKSLLRSINVAPTSLLPSILLRASSNNNVVANSVQSPGLNPNWNFESYLFLSRNSIN